MAIPVWPDDLPARPLHSGYSRGVGDGRLFSQRTAGPPAVRRRTSAATKSRSVQFQCSTDELARFERFWSEDTNEGTLPFLTIDPVFDGQLLAADDGLILLNGASVPLLMSSWTLVRFGEGEPTTQPVGGLIYTVAFDLLILPT